MPRPHSDLRGRLANGEPLVGTFCTIPDPSVVEMVASSGFDFVCIDTEHSPIGRIAVESLVRAADVAGRPALVRVADNRPELIAAALDSGAAGVVVPRVDTAADAERAVRATRYPPLGERGGYPGRASWYNQDLADYMARANDELLLVAQVESPLAVRNANAVAAVDGIDALYAAPGDLSVAIGATGEPLDAALRSVVRAARAHRRTAGLFQPDPGRIDQWHADGVGLFFLAADAIFLTEAAAAAARSARNAGATTTTTPTPQRPPSPFGESGLRPA
ncbi:HpcH/HpaI aldolase family protein [Streptomyces violens]|uniref:HpcH/HpaI aldolase family protein n=1 Tax=Streptomyces violens TaxID=66377 RepID=UPI0007C73200|nr:aldolase/citrate lyase family protein [Streptomyces violens]